MIRKLIIVVNLVILALCGAVLYGPAVPLVPEPIQLLSFKDLSPGLTDALIHVQSNEPLPLTVSFSHSEHFYNETLHVSITASDPDAEIFYTLDSSTPTVNNERFTQPITFISEENVECYVLKAIAVDDDVQSAVTTHTYFVGETVDERFSTPYVFSISTDEVNLYDYDTGILVTGRQYDEFMEANPDTEVPEHYRPANVYSTGRDWEKPIYVEVFTSDGVRVVSQNAGMRVVGNTSRTTAQKSLRLIARRQYEPGTGKFQYNFFQNHASADMFNTPIMSYDSLILRNDGNEAGGRIRTPLATKIALGAGFTAASPNVAAATFINGEYYGYHTLCVRINEQFLQDLYSAPESTFEIRNSRMRSEIIEADEHTNRQYIKLLEYAADGFDDFEMLAFHEFFDVDNFLFYFAINTYIANADWPFNPRSIDMWRYTGSQDTANCVAELDGRWRFHIWDLDISLNRNADSASDFGSIGNIYYPRGDYIPNPLFIALVQRPEYAEQFSNYICDLAYGHFSVENVNLVMQEINNNGLRELEEHCIWYDDDFERHMRYRGNVMAFIEERPGYILNELREIFGYTSIYRIVSDGTCKINTLNGNEGTYFVENNVPVTPILDKGYVFDHWLLNGMEIFDEELFISADDADANGVVHVSAKTREQFPPLFFAETFDTGDYFGFTMYNPTDSVQSTRGLYLSDDIDNLKRWQFPALNIRPGSTWEFVGEDSATLDSLLKIGLNFNPRYGEVIFLSNEAGEVLDWIAMEFTSHSNYRQ